MKGSRLHLDSLLRSLGTNCRKFAIMQGKVTVATDYPVMAAGSVFGFTIALRFEEFLIELSKLPR